MKERLNIMIVAGEASGDAHAAKLVKAMNSVNGAEKMAFFGAAGPRMREAGVEAVIHSDDLSIVGLPEIARALPKFLSAFRKLKNAAVKRRADAVILVDFPEFNLKLAKSLKKKGIKVVYYISPQLWAWRKYRIRTIRKHVDLLLTILPFEMDWYAEHGVRHVEYVGSPMAREVHADSSKEEFCMRHGLDAARPIVSLLPGSRHKEIVRILPELMETAAIMAKRRPETQFVIAMASERHAPEIDAAAAAVRAKGTEPPEMTAVFHETYDALNASDAAAVTSGTATLETGIIGTPLAIVYRSSAFNYRLMRPLISVDHFGLINLIAGERIAKEMIQDEFTAESLAAELERLLEPLENQRMRERLKAAADRLGHGGASARAAEAILKLLS